MAWATMHFATGMCCAAATGGLGCLVLRKGWGCLPGLMTLGGIWAMVPDYPRIFREDFPNAPFAEILGSKALEAWLVDWGNAFCFHRVLDNQPHEFALAGMAMMVALFNLGILHLMWLDRTRRRSLHRVAESRGSNSSSITEHPNHRSSQPTIDPDPTAGDSGTYSLPEEPWRKAS